VPDRPLAKTLFFLAAAPWVVAAAWRLARRDRAVGFGRLVEAQRQGGVRPLPSWLARPEWLAGTLERLLPLLPPRRYGPCLKRALVLLELWTRCGLAPTLHLGFDLRSPERHGHAWLTATAADGRRLQVSGPLATVPAFEL
jgi:hypothetical protein